MSDKWDTTILGFLLFVLTFIAMVVVSTPENIAARDRCWNAVLHAPSDSIRTRIADFCTMPKGAEP